MCVCIYIYVYIYIHTYIHIYIYMYTHSYTYMCSVRWIRVAHSVRRFRHFEFNLFHFTLTNLSGEPTDV